MVFSEFERGLQQKSGLKAFRDGVVKDGRGADSGIGAFKRPGFRIGGFRFFSVRVEVHFDIDDCLYNYERGDKADGRAEGHGDEATEYYGDMHDNDTDVRLEHERSRVADVVFAFEQVVV